MPYNVFCNNVGSQIQGKENGAAAATDQSAS
jgi:hypothetical protein